jgi:hypothetical protein
LAELVVVVEVAARCDEELTAVVGGVPRHVVGGRVVLAARVRELDEEAGRLDYQITPSHDGLPARKASAGYPLTLPPDRLLVDEPGHQWDFEAAVRQAAAVLLDD